MSYFDEDYYDNELSLKDVVYVSQFRHYLNCTNDVIGLSKKFNTTNEMIFKIYENFRGKVEVSYLVTHFEEELKKKEDNNKRKQEAYWKNVDLISQLEEKRKNICGLGTRKLKLFLNKKIKENDILAKAYRLALEIEDKNISAKKTIQKYSHSYWINGYEYSDKIYAEKHKLILELMEVCRDNGFVYGYQDSDNYSSNTIIYFELPNMEQISFHTNMEEQDKKNIPRYEKDWDNKINSTLIKIENTLNELYYKEFNEKINFKK